MIGEMSSLGENFRGEKYQGETFYIRPDIILSVEGAIDGVNK